jgi:hypothetical protein
MLKRRKFLMFSTLLGFSSVLNAKNHTQLSKEFKSVEETIDSVLTHLFPEESKFPSSKSMRVASFLFHTISHKSYDKDVRDFVIEGAKELDSRENNFIKLSHDEKEKALRAYEETNYGSAWLSRIMVIAIEGILSDPIYGSNVNQMGWRSLSAYVGSPRPKSKYLS